MDASTRRAAVLRAEARCEYCGINQTSEPLFRFHVEHIIPRQHGGASSLDNLALACGWCNRHKGPNLTALDPQTGEVTLLFHPRLDKWQDHFAQQDGVIEGLTPVGRATLHLCKMNEKGRCNLRRLTSRSER